MRAYENVEDYFVKVKLNEAESVSISQNCPAAVSSRQHISKILCNKNF